jgi:hypothetical protein
VEEEEEEVEEVVFTRENRGGSAKGECWVSTCKDDAGRRASCAVDTKQGPLSNAIIIEERR